MRKYEYPTKNALIEIAHTICDAVSAYPNRKKYSEKHVELLLHHLLSERYRRVKPQKVARLQPKAGAKKNNQIDFEVGTTNRVSIEFAVRRVLQNVATGHQPAPNKSELLKLTNETVSQTRYLLIVDISGRKAVTASSFRKLYEQYRIKHFQKSRVKSVTVLYVHPEHHRDYAVRVLM